MYQLIFRSVLCRFDAERAHDWGLRALSLVMRIPGVRLGAHSRLFPRDERLQVRALGHVFATPLGLAAGFDKEADHFEDLACLGFGSVEIGTVTPIAQAGNPKPRLFRLPDDDALLNRMGFPNQGAQAIATKLRRSRKTDVIVGANIGKNKLTAAEDAANDYVATAEALCHVADYLAINVSSPNTPGLRTFEAADGLRGLLTSFREGFERGGRSVPILVKISSDLPDHEVEAVGRLALEFKLDGLIAVNTTLSREGLSSRSRDVALRQNGGVSGSPVRTRAVDVLHLIRRTVGDELTIISVGGVESAADVWSRVCAGASLVQTYTAFVYGGPLWPAHLNKALLGLVDASRFACLQDAIGSTAERPLEVAV